MVREKNLHFCTLDKLTEIKDKIQAKDTRPFDTYRTGFVPSIYSGDIININERIPGEKDILLAKGRVSYILPEEYQELDEKAYNEIQRYNRQFHKRHWFFLIGIELIIEEAPSHD